MLIAAGGCGPYYADNSLFSPDSRTVAYVLHKQWDAVPAVDAPTLMITETICWAPAGEPSRVRSTQVQTVLGGDCSLSGVRLIFSPDSQHLLAASTRTLTSIDLKSGSAHQLSLDGERVTAAAWLNDREIGYAAHTNPRRDPSGVHSEITDRTFWRQRIEVGSPRSRVYAQSGVTHILRTWPPFNEHWAPDGRYVVFAPSADAGPVQCLNVQTGQIRELGASETRLRAASWRPDGSAVVCILQNRDRPRTQAVLVAPDTGERHDFTTDFVETFGAEGRDELEWTADGEYILIHDVRLRTCLFRPYPWKMIVIEQALDLKLGGSVSRIKVASVPGHVMVWSDKDRAFDQGSRIYLSNLDASDVRRFVSPGGWGWPDVLSPDRRLLARVEPPAKLAVYPVEFEAAGAGSSLPQP